MCETEEDGRKEERKKKRKEEKKEGRKREQLLTKQDQDGKGEPIHQQEQGRRGRKGELMQHVTMEERRTHFSSRTRVKGRNGEFLPDQDQGRKGETIHQQDREKGRSKRRTPP
jgi:hypothetical protein